MLLPAEETPGSHRRYVGGLVLTKASERVREFVIAVQPDKGAGAVSKIRALQAR